MADPTAYMEEELPPSTSGLRGFMMDPYDEKKLKDSLKNTLPTP